MKIELDISLSLSEIASATRGRLGCDDADVKCICTDSREASEGDLFIALSGERWDGNDFAKEALWRGAYVLGRRDASIFVDNTETAILRLASYYKSKLPCLRYTVAITGSVGKTTTKELTAAIISQKYKVHTNLGNFNNYIGLLHTVTSASKDTEILIVEMGMNHRGEISRLSHAVNPDVAVITNVGTAHIGNLGSREAIAGAKLEICDGMRDGALIVPHGEPLFKLGRTVSVGCDDGDFALLINKSDARTSNFRFRTKDITLNAEVPLVGTHILTSLAFALSVADLIGLNEDEMTSGLMRVDPSRLRQRRIQFGRYDVYDDTYSSSPEAAIAVIRALTEQNPDNVSAVLGDMLELGEHCEMLHKAVGAAAAKCGIRNLYLFGTYAKHTADGAFECGMPKERVFVNAKEDLESTARQIRASYAGEVLIVKASHAIHAERLFDFLKG